MNDLITLKNLSLQLSQNDEFLEAIFENAPIPMMLVSDNVELFKINKAGKSIGFREDDEFLGKRIGHVLDCISSFQDQRGCGHGKECSNCVLRSSVRSTFAKKTGIDKIPLNMVLMKENVEVPYAFLLSTSFISFNSVSLALLVFEDITAIISAEKALFDEEFRYKQITRAITDYIYTVIVEGQSIHTIHTIACESITGYTVKEFEANPDLWIEIIYHDDRAAVLNFFKTLTDLSEKIDIEYRIVCKDGSIKWVTNTLVKKKPKSAKSRYFDGVIKDITSQKLAEEALEDKNRLFNTLLDNLPIGIFMVSKKTGKPIIANKHAIYLLGRGIEPDSDIENMSSVYKAYIAGTHDKYPIEDTPIYQGLLGVERRVDNMEIEHPGGSRLLLEIAGCPVLDANGNVTASLVGFYDITQRRNSELALRESEKKLSIIFEYSHIGFALGDKNGKVEYMNPAFCRIIGYQPDAEYDIKLPLIFEKENPGILDQIISGEKNFVNVEKKFERRKNEVIWIQLQVSCFRNHKNEIVNYIVIAEDITSRKHAIEQLRTSEEKFRNIFNTSNDAILISDFDGHILEINEMGQRRIGLDTRNLSKIRLEDIIDPADKQRAIDQFRRLKDEGSVYFETNYVNSKGEKFFVEINSRLIDYNGKKTALSISRDITERKHIQQKIMNAIIEAEEKERTYFSQELHDGIGPLLSTIKLYLQWIKDPKSKTDKDAILADALVTIEETIVSIKEISNRLSPGVLQKFGLQTALMSYVKKIENIGKINFEIKVNLPERISPQLETMLYRVFVEAVNNAVKYSGADKIQIQLSVENDWIQGLICDNGDGFDVNNTLLKKAGNGLVNMQNRIQTYQGSFNIVSKLNKGTRIILRIPIGTSF